MFMCCVIIKRWIEKRDSNNSEQNVTKNRIGQNSESLDWLYDQVCRYTNFQSNGANGILHWWHFSKRFSWTSSCKVYFVFGLCFTIYISKCKKCLGTNTILNSVLYISWNLRRNCKKTASLFWKFEHCCGKFICFIWQKIAKHFTNHFKIISNAFLSQVDFVDPSKISQSFLQFWRFFHWKLNLNKGKSVAYDISLERAKHDYHV